MLKVFDAESSDVNLRVFRFLYCSFLACMLPNRALFFFFNSDLGLHRGILFAPTGMPLNVIIPLFISLNITLGVCLLLAAVNYRPRWNLTAATIIFLLVSQPTEAHLNPYDSNIVFFNLLVLALSSSPYWTLQALKLNLALVYFSAFVSKMVNGNGLFWASGTTLQGYLLERHLMTGNILAGWLAENLWICFFLSCVTLVAEGTFWTVLIPSRLAPAVALSGFMMHVSIYFMMSINFRFFMLSYLVFMPYEKIIEFARSRFYRQSPHTF